MQTFDVIGLGALNVDFITPASSRLRQDFEAPEYSGLAEFGTEKEVDDATLRAALDRIGQSSLQAHPGGSALNVLHALARLDLGLNTGMIGCGGQSPAREVDFRRLLSSLGIADEFVWYVEEQAGQCLSYIHEGERALNTSPGANRLTADFIKENFDPLVNYLCCARIVHVTSLLDDAAPGALYKLLSAVRDRSPLTLVSFDPGYAWALHLHEQTAVAEAIGGVLSLSSFLFLNYREFCLIGGHQAGETDDEVAARVFEMCSDVCELIVLKKYDGVELFRGSAGSIASDRIARTPLEIPEIEDATGAGDVFAAGVLAAAVSSALQGPLGVAIGMSLAREKLQHVGTTGHHRFAPVSSRVLDRALAQAADERDIKTIAFVDIAGSTRSARILGDRRHKDRTEIFKDAGRDAVARWHGELAKEIGDELMLLFDTPALAVEALKDMANVLEAEGISVRAGIHTGPISQERTGEIAGIAVNAASRIVSTARPGQIVISRCTKDLLDDGTYEFALLATHKDFKGLEGESWETYLVR